MLILDRLHQFSLRPTFNANKEKANPMLDKTLTEGRGNIIHTVVEKNRPHFSSLLSRCSPPREVAPDAPLQCVDKQVYNKLSSNPDLENMEGTCRFRPLFGTYGLMNEARSSGGVAALCSVRMHLLAINTV